MCWAFGNCGIRSKIGCRSRASANGRTDPYRNPLSQRQMLEWAGLRGRELGANWLRLDCAADNERLKAFYAGLGFEPVRVQTVADAQGLEVLLMRRPIT